MRLILQTTGSRKPQEWRILISSLHEMLPVGEPARNFMKPDMQASFPLGDQDFVQDIYTERLAIGQILTRFALGLSSFDPLPHEGDERLSLLDADIPSCRGNLIRSIALKLMATGNNKRNMPIVRKMRPSFACCTQDISTWDDDKFHHFLVRFHDYINSRTYKQLNQGLIYRKFNKFRYEVCGPAGEWLTAQNLPNFGYELIIRGARAQEMKNLGLAPTSLAQLALVFGSLSSIDPSVTYYNTDAGPQADNVIVSDQDVEVTIRREGFCSLFRTYRNEAAHFFDFCSTTGHNMALSRDYVNYWRTQFPMMVTAAWLIAIEENFFRIASFAEFFTCPQDDFYALSKSKNCRGAYKP